MDINGRLALAERRLKHDLMARYMERLQAILTRSELDAYTTSMWEWPPSEAAIAAGWKADDDPEARSLLEKLDRVITAGRQP